MLLLLVWLLLRLQGLRREQADAGFHQLLEEGGAKELVLLLCLMGVLHAAPIGHEALRVTVFDPVQGGGALAEELDGHDKVFCRECHGPRLGQREQAEARI
eukprot:2225737-Pyramimonas_sp.AAC.1